MMIWCCSCARYAHCVCKGKRSLFQCRSWLAGSAHIARLNFFDLGLNDHYYALNAPYNRRRLRIQHTCTHQQHPYGWQIENSIVWLPSRYLPMAALNYTYLWVNAKLSFNLLCSMFFVSFSICERSSCTKHLIPMHLIITTATAVATATVARALATWRLHSSSTWHGSLWAIEIARFSTILLRFYKGKWKVKMQHNFDLV